MHIADNLTIEPARLLQERAIIQGASGSGKSYLLRRLLEQALARGIPITVIDLEGEYITLPSCAIIGGTDIGSHVASYALAESSARHGLSAVIDLSDIDPTNQQTIAASVIDSYMQLPQTHWRARLVVVDEAHQLAPQVGKPASAQALANLASRGRKRGLALIAATQRLSKLNKNVAAELRNVFIGQTTIESDARKACELLCWRANPDARRKIQALAHEFIGYGPSIGAHPKIIRSLPPVSAPPAHARLKSAEWNPQQAQITALHYWVSSAFRSRPILALDCLADPSTILASAKWIADNITPRADTMCDWISKTTALAIGAPCASMPLDHAAQSHQLAVYWPSGWYRYNRPGQTARPLDGILVAHEAYNRLDTCLLE